MFEHYAKHAQAVGPEVRDPVGDTAIHEHDWAVDRMLTLQLKLKHMALERWLVTPGQDVGVELKLLLNDIPSRLPDSNKAHRSEMIKQRRLSHAWTTRQGETSSVRLRLFNQLIHSPLFFPMSGTGQAASWISA
jgi:hypothetical protein